MRTTSRQFLRFSGADTHRIARLRRRSPISLGLPCQHAFISSSEFRITQSVDNTPFPRSSQSSVPRPAGSAVGHLTPLGLLPLGLIVFHSGRRNLSSRVSARPHICDYHVSGWGALGVQFTPMSIDPLVPSASRPILVFPVAQELLLSCRISMRRP